MNYQSHATRVKGTTRVSNTTAPAAVILRSPDAVQTLNKHSRTKTPLELIKGEMYSLASTPLNLLKSDSSQDKMCFLLVGEGAS